jgi:hypothetical protein
MRFDTVTPTGCTVPETTAEKAARHDCVCVEGGGHEGWFFRDKEDYEEFSREQLESDGSGSISVKAANRQWRFINVQTEKEFLRRVALLKQVGYLGHCLFEPL